MSKLEILTYPNKFLRKPTRAVQNIDGNLQQLIEDMTETMFHASGVGLASIQIGHGESLIVYQGKPEDPQFSPQVIINPKLVDRHGEVISENEGCLSVPEFRADVKRAATLLVEGIDRDGNPLQLEADGFLAIVLQHEIDHLRGTLFIDHISALKRELYKRRIKKMLRHK